MISEHLTVFAPGAGSGTVSTDYDLPPLHANHRPAAGSQSRIRFSALSSVNFAVPLEWFRERHRLSGDRAVTSPDSDQRHGIPNHWFGLGPHKVEHSAVTAVLSEQQDP